MSFSMRFHELLDLKTGRLSQGELTILEAELFIRLFENLKTCFKIFYKNDFCLQKLDAEMENAMIEKNFLKYLINDILVSQEYSLEGISYYTQIPEEVLCDIMIGQNSFPSLLASLKIINMHRSIRPNLYRTIAKKITTELLEEQNPH